jgi:glycosyltransferase involved in cell wall biosynthesis
MEKYIYQNFFSILNQSFQDFEIIVINDNSNDNSEVNIKNIQLEDDRIKLISHSRNLGFYFSRTESIFNSKGKYILLMNPDGMYMNANLFQELYKLNLKNNLDIIEFSVFNQSESGKNIYFPYNDFENHFHKFDDIINQPELSNILYYKPRTKEYTYLVCRSIFNKMIRRDILIKTDIYLRNEYYNKYIIINEGPIINVVSYQIARNFTNIYLPGYLLINKRAKVVIYNKNFNLEKIKSMNLILYINMLYKYISEYNKDRNFLYFEMKYLNYLILEIKDKNLTQIITNAIELIERILKDKILSKDFGIFLDNLLTYFKN